MKRLAAILVSFLAACAGKQPPPMASPLPSVTHPLPQTVGTIASDADAAHAAADSYVFSERSTAAGIATVRGLSGRMHTAVRRMRNDPTAANILAARNAVGALREYLGTVRSDARARDAAKP